MGKELEDQYDQIIPGAAGKAGAFLGVLQKRCEEQGLGINLQPTKRGFRDQSVVLRGAIKAGRGNTLELEVFADAMGNNLHVGYQLSRPVAGGSALSNVGIFGEMNAMARRGAGNAGNVRAQSGMMQAFHGMVFLPVLEQLTEAVQQSQSPPKNGFLGA
jgi:hypothetical protein